MKNNIIELHQPCPSCTSSDAYCVYEDGHGYCFSCSYFKPKDSELNEEDITYEYLPWRGVTKETMEFYKAKTKIKDGEPNEISFPYGTAAKIRTLKEKGFYSTGEISVQGLFGGDKFSAGSAKAITITEGELDALAVYQVLGSKYPAVSVQSATAAKRDCTLDRE